VKGFRRAKELYALTFQTSPMTPTIIDHIGGFLMHPAETFRNVKTDTLKEAFLFYILILLLNAVLSVIMAVVIMRGIRLGGWVLGGSVWMGLPGAFIGTIAGGLVLLFVGGLWLHFLVYIVGGRKQIGQTLKALMYGATPYLLLGWIPVVNLVAGIWAIGIGIIGIRELHEISTQRAVFAGLVWAISVGMLLIAGIYDYAALAVV